MNKLELIISSDLSKLSEVENFIDHIIIAFQIKEKLRGKITVEDEGSGFDVNFRLQNTGQRLV